jgi:hypothetical protein
MLSEYRKTHQSERITEFVISQVTMIASKPLLSSPDDDGSDLVQVAVEDGPSDEEPRVSTNPGPKTAFLSANCVAVFACSWFGFCLLRLLFGYLFWIGGSGTLTEIPQRANQDDVLIDHKVLYTFWDDTANVPQIVREALLSWKLNVDRRSGWEVVLITNQGHTNSFGKACYELRTQHPAQSADDLSTCVTVVPIGKLLPKFESERPRNYNLLASQVQADVIRMMVLLKNGGAWLDASSFLNRDLGWVEDWIAHKNVKDFFGYLIEPELMHNWFMVFRRANNPFLRRWIEVLWRIWDQEKFDGGGSSDTQIVQGPLLDPEPVRNLEVLSEKAGGRGPDSERLRLKMVAMQRVGAAAVQDPMFDEDIIKHDLLNVVMCLGSDNIEFSQCHVNKKDGQYRSSYYSSYLSFLYLHQVVFKGKDSGGEHIFPQLFTIRLPACLFRVLAYFGVQGANAQLEHSVHLLVPDDSEYAGFSNSLDIVNNRELYAGLLSRLDGRDVRNQKEESARERNLAARLHKLLKVNQVGRPISDRPVEVKILAWGLWSLYYTVFLICMPLLLLRLGLVILSPTSLTKV